MYRFKLSVTKALTLSLLALSLMAIHPAGAFAAEESLRATLTLRGAPIGSLDRSLREFAEVAGVQIVSLRSRAAYSWQVSTIAVEGDAESVEQFRSLLEQYKAENGS